MHAAPPPPPPPPEDSLRPSFFYYLDLPLFQKLMASKKIGMDHLFWAFFKMVAVEISNLKF